MLRVRLSLSIALFGASLFNLFWILDLFLSRVRPGHAAHTFRARDFPQALPIDLGDTIAMTVEDSAHYGLSNASWAEWETLILPGYGFAHLGGNDRLFSVSVSHSLHCLRIIAQAFHGSSAIDAHHAEHCLGYLRNAALCAADVTLEPGAVGTRDYASRAPGATHACRDWSKVDTWMQDSFAGWNERHPAK